jgi:zinc/manganese transport system substrate-binding protein
MKKFLLFFCLFFVVSEAQARIKILACEQEWSALAREIVGTKAEIVTVIPGSQNPAVPLLLTSNLYGQVQGANLVFCSGNGLEDQWLSQLLQRSGNSDVDILMAANYAPKVKVAVAQNDGANFDYIKAQKMARVHLNPHNISRIAAEFTNRIKTIDPLNADFYQQSYDNFSQKWNEAMKRWDLQAQALRGFTIVMNNDSWDYMVDWLRLEVVVKVAPQSGGLPSVAQMSEMLKILRDKKAQIMIYSAFDRKEAIFDLAKQSNVPTVMLPFTTYNIAGIYDLFSLFDNTLKLLVSASKN